MGSSEQLQPNRLVYSAAWNSGFVLWTILISFIVTPILISSLGLNRYGILVILWSITGLMATLNFGFGETIQRYVARFHSEQNMAGINRVFDATLSVYVLLCGSTSIAIMVLAPTMVDWLSVSVEERQLTIQLLRISGVSASLSVVSGLFASIAPGLLRYDVIIKIQILASVFRSTGYILLAMLGYDIVHIVILDFFVGVIVSVAYVISARSLLPELKVFPSFSFNGIREISSYSAFSFFTTFLYRWHLDSGKLLVARYSGPESVAYLSTPDNLAQRIHEIVARGIGVSLSEFSRNQSKVAVEALFWQLTWIGTTLSTIMFVPFILLIDDFLRLWIDREFAMSSAPVAKTLAMYLVATGTFIAAAAYFRGIGKPWVVTLVLLLSLIITVTTAIILIPAIGVLGAGYAYLAGSVAPLLATIIGGFAAFGWSAARSIVQSVAIPLLAGGISYVLGLNLLQQYSNHSWLVLSINALLMTLISVGTVIGLDMLFGDMNAPSRLLIRRLRQQQ